MLHNAPDTDESVDLVNAPRCRLGLDVIIVKTERRTMNHNRCQDFVGGRRDLSEDTLRLMTAHETWKCRSLVARAIRRLQLRVTKERREEARGKKE